MEEEAFCDNISQGGVRGRWRGGEGSMRYAGVGMHTCVQNSPNVPVGGEQRPVGSSCGQRRVSARGCCLGLTDALEPLGSCYVLERRGFRGLCSERQLAESVPIQGEAPGTTLSRGACRPAGHRRRSHPGTHSAWCSCSEVVRMLYLEIVLVSAIELVPLLTL